LPRAVLDTNILVSAFFWEGNERTLLRRCRDGEIRSVTSPGMLEELDRILIRKFGVPEGKVKDYLGEVFMISDLVFPRGSLKAIERDPTDDMVLETAVLGKADVIFTGDKHHLKLGSYEEIEIRKASLL